MISPGSYGEISTSSVYPTLLKLVTELLQGEEELYWGLLSSLPCSSTLNLLSSYLFTNDYKTKSSVKTGWFHSEALSELREG